MITPESFLLLISSTLFLCYLSGLIYTKTRIPDIVWLLGFGILLGPVLGVFEKDIFVKLSPLMSVVALCIITFDSGICIDIGMITKTLLKSFTLTIATFLAVVSSVGFIVSLLMPNSFSLLKGMLLGTMVAGISTVAIKSLLDGLQKLIPNLGSTRALLMLESTLCDPIRIVTAITIIRLIMFSSVSIRNSLRDIVFTFMMASILGLAFGLVWAEVLDKLRNRPFNYVLTLAALFPVYLITEGVAGDGGGTMATFIFGLVLANYGSIAKRRGLDRNLGPDQKRMISFNEEIIFFLKSYYFVYIGLILTLSSYYLVVGLGIVALLLAIRYAVATGVGRLMMFSMEELVVSRLVFTLGTSTLVMSQLPAIWDLEGIYFPNPGIYAELCLPIVLGTVIFASIFSPLIARNQLKLLARATDIPRE